MRLVPELVTQDATTLPRLPLARGHGHPLGDPPGTRRLLAKLERDVLSLTSEARIAGRYALLEQIGAGGLGVVYAAYDGELDRRVALKFLRLLDVTADRGHERLVREARAMAKLSHPNVVTVYDVGAVDDEVFIAMELVDGVPLSTWLRARSRTWQQVREVLVQAGRGLAAAHEAGLVHRDFKPHNVLVGADGRARVLDFGLARLAGGRAANATSSGEPPRGGDEITATGSVAGTPAYMAPEQLRGGAVGMAADQFAFCVTLFEGVFGHRPFEGSDLHELEQAIASGITVAPRNPNNAPAWLQRAIHRGLRVDPAERFASMHALLGALEHDRKRRKRRLAGLVLACLLGAGAATAMAWLPSMPTPEQLAEVEALVEGAREAAEQRHYLVPPADDPTAGTAYAWVRRLEQIEGPAAEAAVERAETLRGDFALALVELGDAYWDEEGGKPYAADYYAWALVFDDGNARARARAMLTHGELRSVLARAEASTFDAADRLTADALEFLAEARAREQGARIGELRSRRPRAASALASGARGSDARRAAVRSIGADPNPPAATRPDPPAPVLAAPPRAAEGAARRSRRPDDESHRARRSAARTLSREGRALLATGRDREADALFHRALELDPRDATALEGLARLQFDRGRNNEALRWVELAVKAAPRNAGLRLLSGDIHMRVLEYAAARRHYERAAKLGHGKAQGRLRLLDEELGR